MKRTSLSSSNGNALNRLNISGHQLIFLVMRNGLALFYCKSNPCGLMGRAASASGTSRLWVDLDDSIQSGLIVRKESQNKAPLPRLCLLQTVEVDRDPGDAHQRFQRL